jgi:hypothetical protein
VSKKVEVVFEVDFDDAIPEGSRDCSRYESRLILACLNRSSLCTFKPIPLLGGVQPVLQIGCEK